jgi:hypothetical protein
MTPLLEHVGVRLPRAARGPLTSPVSPHLVEQVVSREPWRRATGWVGATRMLGGEAHATGLAARGQYHPATAHWQLPRGGVGWLRLRCDGPSAAAAREDRLDVRCLPHPRRGPVPLRWESNVAAERVEPERWDLPGLTVSVRTDARLVDAASRTYEPVGDGGTRMSLAFG